MGKLIFLWLLLFGLSNIVKADQYEKLFAKAEAYERAKKYARAASSYLSIYKKSKSAKEDTQFVNATYYKYAISSIRNDKGEKRLIELVKLVPEMMKKYKHENFFLYLSFSEIQLNLAIRAKKDTDKRSHFSKAIKICDWVTTSENQGNVLFQIISAECLGRIHIENGSLLKAEEVLKFANHNLKAIKTITEYDLEAFKKTFLLKLQQTNNRLQKLLKEIKNLEFAKQVGESFLLYRDNVSLMRVNKFTEARNGFELLIRRHPKTPYAAAARLYSPLCLLHRSEQVLPGRRRQKSTLKKDIDQAEKELQSIIEKNAYALYAPNARLELAKIQLEYRYNPVAAEKILVSLDKHIMVIRQKDPMKSKIPELRHWPGMKELAAKLSQGANQEYGKADFWGRVKRLPIKSEQLMNRFTSAFYFNDIEEKCALYRGFIALLAGRKEKSAAQWKRIIQLDPKANDQLLSNNHYTRLKACVQEGRFYSYPEEFQDFAKDKQKKLGFLLVEFYYTIEYWEIGVRQFSCGR